MHGTFQSFLTPFGLQTTLARSLIRIIVRWINKQHNAHRAVAATFEQHTLSQGSITWRNFITICITETFHLIKIGLLITGHSICSSGFKVRIRKERISVLVLPFKSAQPC